MELSLVGEQELCVVQARLVTAVVVALTALGINSEFALARSLFLLKRSMNSMTCEMCVEKGVRGHENYCQVNVVC